MNSLNTGYERIIASDLCFQGSDFLLALFAFFVYVLLLPSVKIGSLLAIVSLGYIGQTYRISAGVSTLGCSSMSESSDS